MNEDVKFEVIILRYTNGLLYEDMLNIGHAEGKKKMRTHDPVYVWDIVESTRAKLTLLVIGDRKPMRSREVDEVVERVKT